MIDLPGAEEQRRKLLEKVHAVVDRYAAKRYKEWEDVRNQQQWVRLEQGRVYKLTDGTTPVGTTPSMQLFTTNSSNVRNNADAERDLQAMREKLGTISKKSSEDQEVLERAIYEARDEWCSDTGEWDATKMPVPEMAKRLAAKLKKKDTPW